MPGPGDVPVLNQRRLRGRRKEGVHDCIVSFQWDKGSCAAHCVTEKVGATFCRAGPNAPVRLVRRCAPQRGWWLHLDDLSPGGWQGSQKDGQALSHHPIRMLRAAHDIAQVADPDQAQPGPVLPGKGLPDCICDLPEGRTGMLVNLWITQVEWW
jgi:hypothetical protein